MQPKRDYQALDRKLGRGMPLEEAAAAVGIPLDEALLYVEKRLQKCEATQYGLRNVAQEALAISMTKLVAIVEEGPRYSETDYNEEGKPMKTRTPLNTDLDAAKALARIAMEALKVSGTAKPATPTDPKDPQGAKRISLQLDLWDAPGNWALKKPE